jgi:putative ABC transport system permease protein
VLAYQGVSNDIGVTTVITTVAAIFIALIMIGSIVVIYNSFAISVSERRRQIGMLITCRNY